MSYLNWYTLAIGRVILWLIVEITIGHSVDSNELKINRSHKTVFKLQNLTILKLFRIIKTYLHLNILFLKISI